MSTRCQHVVATVAGIQRPQILSVTPLHMSPEYKKSMVFALDFFPNPLYSCTNHLNLLLCRAAALDSESYTTTYNAQHQCTKNLICMPHTHVSKHAGFILHLEERDLLPYLTCATRNTAARSHPRLPSMRTGSQYEHFCYEHSTCAWRVTTFRTVQTLHKVKHHMAVHDIAATHILPHS